MTTIIADRRCMEMHSDSRVTLRGYATFSSEKIFRIGDSLFGCSGDMSSAKRLLKWIEDGADAESAPDLGEIDVLELRMDGTLMIWDESCVSMVVEDEYYAVGTGGTPAMCLMDAGLSAEDALRIIEVRDPGTAGPFVVRTLED